MKGTIDQIRTTDDGRVVSYDVLTDKNYRTTRHRRYLRPLHKNHDPKIPKDNVDTADDAIAISEEKADLPEQIAASEEKQAPRRFDRSVETRKTVKAVKMGGAESKPINATIQLCTCDLEDRGRHNGSRGARTQLNGRINGF